MLKTVFGSSASGSTPLLSSDGKTLIKDQRGLSKHRREHFSTPAESALVSWLRHPESDPPTARTSFARRTTYHRGDQESDPADSLRQSIGKGWHPCWNLLGSEPRWPFGLPRCPAYCLGGGDDAGWLLQRPDLSPSIRKMEVSQTAGTTVAFPSSRLQERSLRESSLTEAQWDFRPDRSTVDMIFIVKKLQEKSIAQNKSLYLVFIDLTKAFDTVNREALWTVLERIGYPPKLVSMIRLFHDGMTGQVLSNGNVTDAFVISNGVKQGFVLAPVLFNVFFTCMRSKIWRRESTFVTAWTAPSSTCVDSQERRRACKLSSKRLSLTTTAL